MKVLILSCSTGQGHNAVASALTEAFEQAGHSVLIKDALDFVSHQLSGVVSKGHSYIYRHFPQLNDKGYQYLEKHTTNLVESSSVSRLLTPCTERLYRLFEQEACDAVVTTHVIAAILWTAVKQKYAVSAHSSFVATDYTCSPGVEQSDLNAYFIPDDSLREEFICKGVDPSRIFASGIPVRKAFRTAKTKEYAKAALGLGGKQHILMMCGSMGCGPMQELAELLEKQLTSEQTLTIVCGSNQKLKQQLEKCYSNQPNVNVLGYTEDTAQLMDGADLFLTKPGGISVAEACAKALPMVLMNVVAGCEEPNLAFFTQIGGAVTASDVHGLNDACIQLLAQPKRLQEMSAALATVSHADAAETICKHIETAKERSIFG